MPKWVWPSNTYRTFSIQISSLPPSMHQKLTGHGRFCMQNNLTPDQKLCWFKGTVVMGSFIEIIHNIQYVRVADLHSQDASVMRSHTHRWWRLTLATANLSWQRLSWRRWRGMVFGQVLSVMEFLLVAIVKLVGWEMRREYCGKQIVHSLLSLDYYSVPFLCCCNEMAINIQGSPFSRRQSVRNNFTWLQEMSSSTRNKHCNFSRTKGLNVQPIYTNSMIFTKSLIKYS